MWARTSTPPTPGSSEHGLKARPRQKWRGFCHAQTNLGHATSSFTLDVYGHVSQRMRQQSAERMERFIQSVTG
jgi:hypothetical protein